LLRMVSLSNHCLRGNPVIGFDGILPVSEFK
jgi:hypothetical protein